MQVAGLGTQKDAWGAVVVGRGTLADAVKERVVQHMRARRLPELKIAYEWIRFDDPILVAGGRTAQPHVVCQQHLGSGNMATVALRIARYGAYDLEISWRLFERNVGTQRRIVFILLAMVLGSCGMIAVASQSAQSGGSYLTGMNGLLFGGGFLLCGLLFWAVPLLAERFRSANLATALRPSSRALATTLNHVLKLVLEETGVGLDEVQVLVHTTNLDLNPFLGPPRHPNLPL